MAIIKYKKGNSWVSIPIYVNTGGEVLDYITKLELENKGYISQIKTINGQSLVGSGNINIGVDLSNYYTKNEVSSLIPKNYLTEIPEEYVTESELNQKGYLTQHQSLANYYNKSEVDNKIASAGNFDSTQYYNKTSIDNILKEYATLDDIPSDYLTSSDLSIYASLSWVLNLNFAKLTSIPTSTSELLNDSGFITEIPSRYVTETELEAALGVVSNNEYEAWDVGLINSSARLDITLFSYNAVESVDNYEGIVNALEKVGSSIQMTGSGFDATLSVSYIENTLTLGTIKGRILYGNLTYLLSGKFIAILTSNDHILLQIDRNSYLPVDCLDVTYSLLKAFVDNGVLVPGRKYAITDYSCIYYLYDLNQDYENSASDFEKIIITAISPNKLDEDAAIVRTDGYVPIIECKYTIDNEKCFWTRKCTTLSPKGCIYYLKDANNIETFYDFKHVRFPRYKVSAIGPHTTPNNGSNTIVSPYRAYCTSSGISWSDNRIMIGAGDEIEADLINSIFDGTWTTVIESSKINSGVALGTVDSSYATLTTQPYLNSGDSWDPYMAWVPDMTSSRGFGITSRGNVSSYNTAKVTNSTTDYRMRYTFDYQGTDASEKKKYNTENGLVTSVNLGMNEDYYNNKLPNTVFAISSNNINNKNTFIQDINIKKCSCSHFALTIKTLNFAYLLNIKASLIGACLFIGFFQQINSNVMQRNYINGGLLYIEITLSFNRNTIFGQITHLTCKDLFDTLWYNSMSSYLPENSTSWVEVPDGWYSYHTSIDSWVGGNILGPMLYNKIRPHFNSNTFRSVYNKGNVFDSANLHNSYGQIAYTHIGYGIGLGIKFPALLRCKINRGCFQDFATTFPYKISDYTSFNKFFNKGIWWTDFDGAYVSPTSIANLSDTVVNYINTNYTGTHLRKLRYYNNWDLVSDNHNTVRNVIVTSDSSTLEFSTYCRYVTATLNKSKTLKVPNSIHIDKLCNIIMKNGTTSDITLTLPTTSPYIVLSDKTVITIAPEEYIEIAIVSDGTNIFLRKI